MPARGPLLEPNAPHEQTIGCSFFDLGLLSWQKGPKAEGRTEEAAASQQQQQQQQQQQPPQTAQSRFVRPPSATKPPPPPPPPPPPRESTEYFHQSTHTECGLVWAHGPSSDACQFLLAPCIEHSPFPPLWASAQNEWSRGQMSGMARWGRGLRWKWPPSSSLSSARPPPSPVLYAALRRATLHYTSVRGVWAAIWR